MLDTQLFNTALYGLLAGLATLGGIYMLLSRERWARRNTVYFISFSAGALLAAAFLLLLPEAIGVNSRSLTVVLVTLLVFYVLEHAIGIHTCREGDCDVHSMGTAAFVGIAVHSLLDGIVIGVGFEAGFKVGLAATLGVLLHEIPEGITITALLLHSGYTRRRTLVMGWVVALATPAGAVGAYFFMAGAPASTVGFLLAVGAGSFIYVGASDLLPATHRKFSLANILLVLSGAVLVYLIAGITGGH